MAFRFAVAVVVLTGAGCGRFGFADSSTDGAASDDALPPGSARIAVTITGKGAVEIAGTWCSGACDVVVTAREPISAGTAPRDGWQLDTVSCPACADPSGTVALDAVFIRSPIVANRVFVTSGSAPKPLGGLSGADMLCQQRALSAGLAGTFVAMLATTTVNARSRITGSRGWVLLDGRAVLDQPTGLYAQQINPIDVDETGAASAVPYVASGMNDVGNAVQNRTCADWISTTVSGELRSTTFSGGTFSTTSGAGCNLFDAVFCFETGKQIAVAATPFPYGRYVFTSAGQILGNAGLAAMDTQCSSEAMAAGLPGTYHALVATDGASAASRFTSLAGPWRRPDGVLVTFGDLTTAPLEATINRDATGAPSTRDRLWIGPTDLVTAGTTMDTCSNWTATAGNGGYVRAFDTAEWPQTGAFGCSNQQLGVVCAQD